MAPDRYTCLYICPVIPVLNRGGCHDLFLSVHTFFASLNKIRKKSILPLLGHDMRETCVLTILLVVAAGG